MARYYDDEALDFLAKNQVDELESDCPLCGTNVTLWTDALFSPVSRKPNTLKCGRCGNRWHYRVFAEAESAGIYSYGMELHY